MAFELVGRTAHEWIGAGMFILFILHHILNWKWSKNLFRGKYTLFRILQTVIAALIFVTMLGVMVSSVLISREVFAFLSIYGGRSFGRTMHMFCVYWLFIFLSLHLGIHWNRITGVAGRLFRHASQLRNILLQAVGIGIAMYGVYAFLHREIHDYLFLQTQFVFFNFEEPIIFFFLDYLAAMGLFVWLGHYLAKLTRRTQREKKTT